MNKNQITCYKGAERQRQVIKLAIQQRNIGADNAVILEKVSTFNNTFNAPPLTPMDVEGLLEALEEVQNTRKPGRIGGGDIG